MKRLCLLVMLFAVSTLPSFAQKKPKAPKVPMGYSWSGNEQIVSIPRNIEGAALDSLITQFGLAELRLFQLLETGRLDSAAAAQGWKLNVFNDKLVQLSKSLSLFEGEFNAHDKMNVFEEVFHPHSDLSTYLPTAKYGVNRLRWPGTQELADGRTRFFLKGHSDAGLVLLSGSFNGWNRTELVMQQVEGGWVIDVNLQPGKHLYKFIVDGNWINDPGNEQREDDLYNGFNSVYFRTNHVFRLRDDLVNAKRVYLSGSFNDWREKELDLKLNGAYWELPVYLPNGTHAYKFIADKTWLLDPENPIVLQGTGGHDNNYISFGDTSWFYLPGFKNAKDVFLCGDFNAWAETELRMKRNENGWELPYVIGPGQYQYKFRVDGVWIADPENPLRIGEPPFDNSVITIQPNYTFKLGGFADARKVLISGTFNGWNETDFVMQRQGNDWVYQVYLPYGKHYYKFIVDGQWITDPENPLWEENEHRTGNSVVWLLPDVLKDRAVNYRK